MKEYRLSFVTLYDYENGIIEAIVDDGVEINKDKFIEFIDFVNNLPSAPSGMLANRTHSYSFTFDALLSFRRNQSLRYLAEYLHDKKPNVILEAIWPRNINMQTFRKYDEAMQWLEEKVQQ
ncbi:MAG: hypothetical protein HUJ30_07880 [Gammaproteobacteria bacterium]|nr:hypothetical protein [Gammaproteobacteria bacterium]